MCVCSNGHRHQATLATAETIINAKKWKREQLELFQDHRMRMKRTLNSLRVQVPIFLLIILDLVLFVMKTIDKDTLQILTFAILSIYLCEILCRIYAYKPIIFFKDWFEVLDLTLIVTSFVLNLLDIGLHTAAILVSRALRLFRMIRLAVRS